MSFVERNLNIPMHNLFYNHTIINNLWTTENEHFRVSHLLPTFDIKSELVRQLDSWSGIQNSICDIILATADEFVDSKPPCTSTTLYHQILVGHTFADMISIATVYGKILKQIGILSLGDVVCMDAGDMSRGGMNVAYEMVNSCEQKLLLINCLECNLTVSLDFVLSDRKDLVVVVCCNYSDCDVLTFMQKSKLFKRDDAFLMPSI